MRAFCRFLSLGPNRLLAVLLLAAPGAASVCDQTYYLQSATETVLEGPTLDNLTATKRDLKLDLSDATILHDSVNYLILKQFEGSCGYAQKPVLSRVRLKGDEWKTAQESLYVNLFDTNFQLLGTGFHYWFRMTADTSAQIQVTEVLGKSQQEQVYSRFYATATMLDSVRQESGYWQVGESFFRGVQWHHDSAVVDSGMLANWRDIQFTDTHRGWFKVQFIKAVYDSVAPAPAGRPFASGSSEKGQGFQASQLGEMVIIRPSHPREAPEALTLYNMMGRKVATLHPTGFAYQWNGKTDGGVSAPTGVYFVQSRDEILGKFFYSRPN